MSVSHETIDRLEHFKSSLIRWNKRINLVGTKTSIEAVWQRHILDSQQLLDQCPDFTSWCDLGSGGGFPGLVVAIATKQTSPKVTLVESDMRKCVFLRSVATELSLNVEVINERIERAKPVLSDIISARALAPLSKLLGYAERHGRPDTTLLFPKGSRFEEELSTAGKDWRFSVETIPSKTSPESMILKIEGLERV